MNRLLFVLLTLVLLSLSGCSPSSETPAEQPEAEQPAAEQPMEPEAPADGMLRGHMDEGADATLEDAVAEQPAGEKPPLILCMDPRPEICTQNYDPVCATHKDGSRLTYSNGCAACSNPEALGALPGACEE